ncbi:hypothetical protein ACH5RR_011684 [Cinchona calisaya]|uniref:Uncharacterized protein n=1 Tax=Cinchona calisaya TaxID=153742 RepID=A0ABD3ABH8_9GENT
MLVSKPILLEKPQIQSPAQFLKGTPAPACPGLPMEDASVFNLIVCGGGRTHPLSCSTRLEDPSLEGPKKTNSVATRRQKLTRSKGLLGGSNRDLSPSIQTPQQRKGKKVHQETW